LVTKFLKFNYQFKFHWNCFVNIYKLEHCVFNR